MPADSKYDTNVASKGTLFPEVLVKGMFSLVQGHSALAKLAGGIPLAFNGNEIMTFQMDGEVNLVGENELKSTKKIVLDPVKIVPLKVEYGARISDEFSYATEEAQLDILRGWSEGFAKKVARGLDLMAFHGVNPRTGSAASTLIGTNSFDTNSDVAAITYTAGYEEDNLEDAIAALGEYVNTGFAFSPAFAAALGKVKVNGVPQYPEFKLGGRPGTFNGVPCDVNTTVGTADAAIVGDFANAFKWGYAKQIPLEIIPYGDPDQTGHDLRAYNQLYLRGEAFIGWGILDPAAFARISNSVSA